MWFKNDVTASRCFKRESVAMLPTPIARTLKLQTAQKWPKEADHRQTNQTIEADHRQNKPNNQTNTKLCQNMDADHRHIWFNKRTTDKWRERFYTASCPMQHVVRDIKNVAKRWHKNTWSQTFKFYFKNK